MDLTIYGPVQDGHGRHRKTQEDTPATPPCKTPFPSVGASSGLPPVTETCPAAHCCVVLLPAHGEPPRKSGSPSCLQGAGHAESRPSSSCQTGPQGNGITSHILHSHSETEAHVRNSGSGASPQALRPPRPAVPGQLKARARSRCSGAGPLPPDGEGWAGLLPGHTEEMGLS